MKHLAAGLAMLLAALPAHAEVSQALAKIYCGPEREVRAIVGASTRLLLRGPAGPDGRNVGEVWADPGGAAWFFVELVPDQHMACVVLGGSGLLAPADPAKEGEPS